MHHQFCRKFYIIEDDIIIFYIAREVQNLAEEIMEYIKCFRDRSLEIGEDVIEEILIRIYAKGHGTFRNFLEKARNIGPSVQRRSYALCIVSWSGSATKQITSEFVRKQWSITKKASEMVISVEGTTWRKSPYLTLWGRRGYGCI